MNEYCNSDGACRLCPKAKKYARLDVAAHQNKDPQWRCYCEHTLSKDLQSWVNKAPKDGSKSWLDYCTRHAKLEKVLKLCKEGTITTDGSEVKEL
mmetsp:Transcript_66765/g.176119  ORF Transcript_66765/g.176119 Transcript_66765/m.176119 type:complete len:95 (-) Transcript_66765:247-531(-)